ncbi:hypothetical protein [Spirosoma areae]
MNRTEWDRARVEQYAERTNQSLTEARYHLHRLYMPGCNVEAVDAKVDPHVDEVFKSQNRPVSRLTEPEL